MDYTVFPCKVYNLISYRYRYYHGTEGILNCFPYNQHLTRSNSFYWINRAAKEREAPSQQQSEKYHLPTYILHYKYNRDQHHVGNEEQK